jgi:circadian clock protein KaiB
MADAGNQPVAGAEPVRLLLFVTGGSPLGRTATRAARQFVSLLHQSEGSGAVELEVADVLLAAEVADEHRILATPTLVRLGAVPRRVVGDLSDAAAVSRALDLPLPELVSDSPAAEPAHAAADPRPTP